MDRAVTTGVFSPQPANGPADRGEPIEPGRPTMAGAASGRAAGGRSGVDAATKLTSTLEAKLARLDAELADAGRVVVAFSGGADSTFLAVRAHQVLGDRAAAVTAVSPSLAQSERDDCEALASEWGLAWSVVETHEMERAAYRSNNADRCYHCKAELMTVVAPIAAATDSVVMLGVNVDDLGDHRPGQRAAAEAGARFPLVTAGLTKCDVRDVSRAMGLRTWDKPAAACLASRIPYGTEVSVAVLSRVERAEAVLHGLGFAQCRVRHYGTIARVEVEVDQLAAAVAQRSDIVGGLKAVGYQTVTLDLDGFRSGNLNDALASTRRDIAAASHIG